jgi:hypothetical protein
VSITAATTMAAIVAAALNIADVGVVRALEADTSDALSLQR